MSPPPGLLSAAFQGAAIARADVDEIRLRVVDDRVPDGAAAAELPPFAVPRLRGHRHGFALEAVGGIAGHGEEAPRELARLGVVGGDVAAHAELCAAVPMRMRPLIARTAPVIE